MKETENDIPAIICFAGCDWWYHNRGLFAPQVMSRLANRSKVLFVNSLGMRVPALKQDKYAFRKILRKLKSIARYLRRSHNGVYVFTPISLPFFANSIVGPVIAFLVLLQIRLVMILLSLKEPIFYVGCPPAWEIVKKLRHRYLIYERTDIFEEMPGINKPYITSLDDVLTRTANLVLYVNMALWQEGSKKNPNSLLLGHGVDFERFVHAEESDHIPEELVAIPKPIVGFFGDIDDRVCDFALFEHVAKTLSDVSLVLIGPTSSDVSRLKTYENVFLLGQKPYEQIPHYGKVFDVAIMPWHRNRWIEFCNPVIAKEYLALGKPIVAMDYPELKPYHNVVYVASDYDQFVNSIRTALKECNPHLKLKRHERVRDETWDNKVQQIVDFVKKDLVTSIDFE